MKTGLLLIGGVIGMAAWAGHKQKPTTAKSLEDKPLVQDIIYVSNPEGCDLYKSIGSTLQAGYGYGRDKMATAPSGTMLGRATGEYINGMIEVTTTINTAVIKFWVKKDHAGVLAENDARKDELYEKTEDLKREIFQKG